MSEYCSESLKCERPTHPVFRILYLVEFPAIPRVFSVDEEFVTSHTMTVVMNAPVKYQIPFKY